MGKGATSPGESRSAEHDHEQAEAWLRRNHLAGMPRTPTIVARAAIRERAAGVQFLWIAAVGMVGVAVAVASNFTAAVPDAVVPGSPAGIAAMSMGVLAAYWLVLYYQRVRERRLERSLPRRVARPVATRAADVVVRAFLATAAAGYGVAVVLGFGVAVLAEYPADRRLGLLFGGAVAVLDLITVTITRAVLARHSIATDDDPMLADDALRAEEVRKLLIPLPVAPALIFVVGSTVSATLTWIFLGYSVAHAIAYSIVRTHQPHARSRREEPTV